MVYRFLSIKFFTSVARNPSIKTNSKNLLLHPAILVINFVFESFIEPLNHSGSQHISSQIVEVNSPQKCRKRFEKTAISFLHHFLLINIRIRMLANSGQMGNELAQLI